MTIGTPTMNAVELAAWEARQRTGSTRAVTPLTHGAESAYKRGCRCETCVENQRIRKREYVQRRTEREKGLTPAYVRPEPRKPDPCVVCGAEGRKNRKTCGKPECTLAMKKQAAKNNVRFSYKVRHPEPKATRPTADGCKHHWIIETPNGRYSLGRCKLCQGEKSFDNVAVTDRDPHWGGGGTFQIRGRK